MRHIRLPLVALLVASSLGLATFLSCGSADKPEPGDVARGRRIAATTCGFCHQVEGKGGMIAPPMDKCLSLVETQLRGYEKRAADLKALYPKAYAAEQAAIEALLAQKDPARRYEMWLGEYLRDTKFDNPMTKMGNVLLTPQQKADVVAWLMTKRTSQ